MSSARPYQAISCDFYDYLLEKATLKEEVRIVFLKQKILVLNKLEKVEIETVIVDVFTKKGVEYIKTKEQSIIRLDDLVSVGTEINNKIGCTIK